VGEVKRIPLTDLRYDPQNPRVVERLGQSPTQNHIEQLLLGTEMKARELVPSFIENGYIPYEPLIVRPQASKYTVIEGNRRLAALRSMTKSEDPVERQAVNRHNLNSAPCLVFNGDQKQLLAYLGLRHLSKTKDWSTSAKGAFVERMLSAGIDLVEAGRLTNTTTSALRLILLTRRLFEQANQLGLELTGSGADGETVFWHLGDAVRRTRTKTYLKLIENPDPLKVPEYDQTKFEYLIGWLYGNVKTRQLPIISSIRDIKLLDSCLGNDRAQKALENGANLAEAGEELEAAGASIAGHIERAKRCVERACGGPWPELDAEGVNGVEHSTTQLRSATDQLTALIANQKKHLGKHHQ
jgi:ParB-like chromosome segregation protein Spo0J